MTTWGELIDKTLRSVLRDPDNTSWSSNQVYDALGWALDMFASHTCPTKEVTYEDGMDTFDGTIDFDTTTEVILPDGIFDPIDVNGQVFYTNLAGKVFHLDPANRTEWLHINKLDAGGFVIWPDNKLRLGAAPVAGSILTVRYFGYWDKPSEELKDEDISIPRWAEKPITTLTGAYCLEGLAIESANIDRWKDDTDSGNPEHNALRKQQQFLMGQYEYMVSKYERQDRTNFFRERSRITRSPDYYQKWGKGE